MEDFLINHGIWVLGLCFLIDDLGVPFPSGTTLFLGAIMARTTPQVYLWQLFFVALIFPATGNFALFYAGKHGAKKWLHTHGHKIFLPEERLLKMEKFFQHRHGLVAVFLASMVTNMRPFFAIIAGGSQMKFKKFWVANISGILCWETIVISAGYLIGEHARDIWQEQWPVLLAIIIALLTGWIWLKITNKFFKIYNQND